MKVKKESNQFKVGVLVYIDSDQHQMLVNGAKQQKTSVRNLLGNLIKELLDSDKDTFEDWKKYD